MDFSFGIITSVHTQQYLENTIRSIIDQNIENYEILVIGGKNTFLNSFREDKHFIRHIKFDEDVKKKWITRKKNIIIEESNFENIVFLHDVEWSHRVRRKTKFKFNEESTVYLQKQKEIYFTEITEKNLNIIKNRSFINKKIDRFLVPFRRYRKKKKFFSKI
jgi:hypothetical protein